MFTRVQRETFGIFGWGGGIGGGIRELEAISGGPSRSPLRVGVDRRKGGRRDGEVEQDSIEL